MEQYIPSRIYMYINILCSYYQYISKYHAAEMCEDPLYFWKSVASKFSIMPVLVQKHLAIPATFDPVGKNYRCGRRDRV